MSDNEKPEVTDETTASGNPELRAALARKDERIAALEGKLSVSAFKDAGFPGGPEGSKAAKERAALEKFYQGDRTDSEAIRKFAEEELGYSPGAAKKQEVTHVQPAPSVVADARIDEMDAVREDAVGDPQSDGELEKLRDAHLKKAQEPGGNNLDHIQAAIAAELARIGE